MKGSRILLAEDNLALRETYRLALEKEGYRVRVADSSAALGRLLDDEEFALVVSDIYLGDGTALDHLEQIPQSQPGARVILITAQGTMETVAAARSAGVFEYLAKPFLLPVLVDRVRAALAPAAPEPPSAPPGPESMIIGSDPAIVEVYKAVARVAPLPVPVLLQGETGTGKELVARALHRFGAAPEGPWEAINCGAIPGELLESELFGHRKGAFTGAGRHHAGAIEGARGGTLLLDEVGELPLRLQVKLLRFLQDGEIRPVGADAPTRVPVRVVAATHRDLEAEVAAGRFREDLWYRLAVYRIRLPALRERRADVPLLVHHFLRLHAERLRLEPSSPSQEALDLLGQQEWTGNVRELENVVQRALVDLGGLADAEGLQRMLGSAVGAGPRVASAPVGIGDDLSLAELEKRHIEAVLDRCGRNRTHAAEILGIARKSLYRKARRLGIALEVEETAEERP